MLQTSARLLRLLSLLETRRDWTGADLADRLGVTARTVRTDIGKLRELGYPVEAAPGVQGGYRLGAGAQLPPLLLDDDEAVAVAVGLRTATGVAGIGETSVRALAKLEQVLPSRLRHRVRALQTATVAVPGEGPAVDADVLTAIATAIRASERLRFDYTSHQRTPSRRDVEPHRLVSWGRRWYLVAWDIARDDWRTFRVDRMTPKVPNGPRFTPREPPEGDVAQFVQRNVGAATWRFHARVRLHAPVEHVRARLPIAVGVTPEGPDRCVAEVGSDNASMLGLYLGLLEVDFEVLDAPELAAALAKTGERFLRAAGAGSPPAPSRSTR
ncbi:HTH type 11 transcriptional regulator [Amycolatopsis mediterranei S699]|uniref:HTH type 11 transcriptional regulator n=2 Tax=Amycolatopsis mediterranei TaxID=33910 RepID=A0A0H3D961_AMYMU|nr:YafY family protein [Amycolatopsis mediterranei]ADJ46084.1 HTH type 11 transcriptional regulator [Amycolatopsis mediterranei U32]AFO77795.1 HTH type 11 transcriptional regulator [Amycolatopsis mediterranei S699]AGT84923.1 HTH type 11 transcriptional regulator [Amycolatopsis mediterranei RB]KDO05619.1 DeoR faimly transcriptional regulator [Amycolatopsis mediterranei]KDU88013.1 DeoR faimly transcriptional regulator [Amycolatopsis mediterranei]